jgi:hypothetical protein
LVKKGSGMCILSLNSNIFGEKNADFKVTTKFKEALSNKSHLNLP